MEDLDKEIEEIIKTLPELPRRTIPALTQLHYLGLIATKLGLRDAENAVKQVSYLFN